VQHRDLHPIAEIVRALEHYIVIGALPPLPDAPAAPRRLIRPAVATS
jgi:hypothetical protein